MQNLHERLKSSGFYGDLNHKDLNFRIMSCVTHKLFGHACCDTVLNRSGASINITLLASIKSTLMASRWKVHKSFLLENVLFYRIFRFYSLLMIRWFNTIYFRSSVSRSFSNKQNSAIPILSKASIALRFSIFACNEKLFNSPDCEEILWVNTIRFCSGKSG